MHIVDCQIHAPHDAPTLMPGAPEEVHQQLTLRAVRAALDAVGVEAAVVNWTRAFSEVAYGTYPDRFRSVLVFEPQQAYDLELIGRAVGYPKGLSIPFGDLDDLVGKIAEIKPAAGLVGIRFEAGWRPDPRWRLLADLLRQGVFDPMCEASRITGLPLCMWVAGVLPEVHRLARAYPDVTLIVDHVGLIPTWAPDSDPAAEFAAVLALAEHPNVIIKFSGVVSRSVQPYPFRDIQEMARALLDRFGEDRVMWGTDYTVHPEIPYAEQLHFISHSTLLSEVEKEKVLGATVRRVYDWPEPLERPRVVAPYRS